MPTRTETAELVARVRQLTDVLAAEIVDSDRAILVDLIAGLEELKCAAEGAQAAAAVALDQAVRQDEADRGVPPDRQGRGVAAMVALARRESPHRGQRHLGLAKVLARELPRTFELLRAGKVTEWRATLIARETAHLDLAGRARVEDELADPDPRTGVSPAESLGERQLASRARGLADRLDPAAAVARRRNAEADRHVSLRPAPDTMCWLTALLPVKVGVGILAALTAAADTARNAGDSRSKGQVMADVLAGRILGTGETPAVGVRINLVVSDRALFGAAEDPAWVDGYGDIPAELARELGVAPGNVELRRVYADPGGRLVGLDSKSRCFPEGLAALIKLRDRVCRTPWCDAPVRHVDHIVPAAEGGPTGLDNGQGLCEACNHHRQAAEWTARVCDQIVEIATPTGHRYRSVPPPPPTPWREDAGRPRVVLMDGFWSAA